MATLKELLKEKAEIEAELRRMETDDTVTEEKDGSYRDTLVERWEEVDEETKPIIARMEKIKSITRAAQDPANRESGDGGAGEATRWEGRGPEFMQRKDPFENLNAVRQGYITADDAIARAATVVEDHDRRGLLPDHRGEAATRSAQNPAIARHMLLYGHDGYYDAFRDYVNDPTGPGLQRAAGALSLANAQGGYLLPYFLDPTIVITTDGTTNPYRRLANVKQITTNAYHGVNSAGVAAAYLDEAASASTAAYSGVGQINVFVKKAAAWIYGSLEANEDTNFADQLPRMLQDGKDILEEANFAAGSGANTDNTGVPNGIAHALGTAQVVHPSGGSGTLAANDIYSLEAALGARFRMSQSVGFVANISTINKIRGASPSGAGSSFWATLGDGTPSRLLNHVIEESPSITVTAGTGTGSSGTGNSLVVFGAWDNFLIVDRIGVSMLFEPLIKDPTSGAPKGQQGWFYYWRSGSEVTTANAFRVLTFQ